MVAPALLATMTLAGCAALTNDGGEAGADGETGLPELLATASTGVIRGVVVDQAIRPVASATVTARGPGGVERTSVTPADGFFGFEALAPGTWFVEAHKVAYDGSQTSVEVEAGVGDPPAIKLLMEFQPSEAPFLVELHHEAFVQCIVPGANACAIVNLYPCALAGFCQPIVDDTSYVLLHDEIVALQRTPDWLQLEVVWESTQSLSPDLAVLSSAHSPDDGAGRDARQEAARGGSPLVLRMDPATLEEWETGTVEGLSYEIFGHMEETSAGGSFGFVLNQRVDFYFHVFYGYAPPEGWQFSVDGAFPPPR